MACYGIKERDVWLFDGDNQFVYFFSSLSLSFLAVVVLRSVSVTTIALRNWEPPSFQVWSSIADNSNHMDTYEYTADTPNTCIALILCSVDACVLWVIFNCSAVAGCCRIKSRPRWNEYVCSNCMCVFRSVENTIGSHFFFFFIPVIDKYDQMRCNTALSFKRPIPGPVHTLGLGTKYCNKLYFVVFFFWLIL